MEYLALLRVILGTLLGQKLLDYAACDVGTAVDAALVEERYMADLLCGNTVGHIVPDVHFKFTK